MEDMIECENCGWQGSSMELLSRTEDMADTEHVFCPDCGSREVYDVTEEE